MREKAILELNEKLRTLRGKNIADKEIPILENMIIEIEHLAKGAFTPFLQQPPIRAIFAALAIVGGGSSLPVLDKYF